MVRAIVKLHPCCYEEETVTGDQREEPQWPHELCPDTGTTGLHERREDTRRRRMERPVPSSALQPSCWRPRSLHVHLWEAIEILAWL